jgi:putative transposase
VPARMTNRTGKHLLADDTHKDIIINSLKFFVKEKRIILNAFAPIAIGVSNHIHLIWQPAFTFTPSDIQALLMKQTAKQLKIVLGKTMPLHCKILK